MRAGIFFHPGNLSRLSFIQTAQQSLRHPVANKSHLLRWLMGFGALGLFLVAVVDSSVIPLPIPGSADLLLLLLASQRRATVLSVIWLASSAVAGSILGGYLAWSAGRKGGEVTLERYVPKRHLNRLTGWIERYGAWSIAVAAILPPPIPLTPFTIAAGALKVSRMRFLVAFSLARVARYGLLAWLGLTYGRHIAHLWQKTLSGWGPTILWIYGGLVLTGILFGIWKYRQSASRNTASQPA